MWITFVRSVAGSHSSERKSPALKRRLSLPEPAMISTLPVRRTAAWIAFTRAALREPEDRPVPGALLVPLAVDPVVVERVLRGRAEHRPVHRPEGGKGEHRHEPLHQAPEGPRAHASSSRTSRRRRSGAGRRWARCCHRSSTCQIATGSTHTSSEASAQARIETCECPRTKEAASGTAKSAGPPQVRAERAQRVRARGAALRRDRRTRCGGAGPARPSTSSRSARTGPRSACPRRPRSPPSRAGSRCDGG